MNRMTTFALGLLCGAALGAALAPRGAQSDPSDPPRAPEFEAPPAPRSEAELAAELEHLLAERCQEARHWRRTCSELLASDSAAAVERVIAAFADKASRFPGHAAVFADVLRQVPDPRIGAAALAWLDEFDAAGATASADFAGYVDLAASHGGKRGAHRLLQLLHHDDPYRAGLASRSVGSLADRGAAQALLSWLRTSLDSAPVIDAAVRGMWAWGERSIRGSLLALALDDTTPLRVRAAVFKAEAADLDSAALTPFLDRWWSADDAGRAALAASFGALLANSATAARAPAASAPLVCHALSAGPSCARDQVLRQLLDHRELRDPALLADLQHQLRNGPAAAEREPLTRLIELARRCL